MTIQHHRDLAIQVLRKQVVARFVTGARVPEPDVERWIALWDQRALKAGIRSDSPAYWNAGLRWIASYRNHPVAAKETA